MLDDLSQISWLGVAVATVALAVLGGLYFGALVPSLYARALGREDQPVPEAGALTYAGPVVGNLVMVLASAVLISALGIESVADAVVLGLVVGLGYLVPMTFVIAINPNVPRPLLYGVVNAPYFLVASVASSVLLVVLP